jgi:hypothetical protein
MATTTRVLDADVNGTVYTTNANATLEALDTCHSGATAPTDEVANGKLWFDTSTTPGILKVYNNASWQVVHSGTAVYLGGTGAANKLDDYEEGTWSPTYSTTGTAFGSVTIDATVTGGTYTKIGDVVVARGYIRTSAVTVGSASGGLRIGGIPFVSAAGASSTTKRSRGSCSGDTFATSAPSFISIDNSSSFFLLYSLNAVGSASAYGLTPAATCMATGAFSNVVVFTIVYATDS